MRKETLLFMIIGLLLVASCVQQPPPVKPTEKEKEPISTETVTGTIELEGTQELRKFTSAQELTDFLKNAQSAQTSYDSNMVSGGARTFAAAGMDRVMVEAEEMAVAPMAETKSIADTGTDDYSTTNIQVEGVDEADIVKNDGKYIYIVSRDKLIIVDAYPAEKAKIISETELDGNPSNIFIHKDRLVVLTTGDEEV